MTTRSFSLWKENSNNNIVDKNISCDYNSNNNNNKDNIGKTYDKKMTLITIITSGPTMMTTLSYPLAKTMTAMKQSRHQRQQ